MTTLPHDILLQIAQYLPALVLCDLISLNSTFFEIAMDCRYRQISFAYLDNRMLRNLSRLRDPAVARRVRILHIYPGFLQEVICKEEETAPVLRRSLRYRLVDLANLLLEHKLFPKHPKFKLIRTLRRTEDVVQIMLEVLGGLPNVTDFYVTWCGIADVSATAQPFLSTILQSNLRKLCLELSLENVQNLLKSTLPSKRIEELQLIIHSENLDSDDARSDIMKTHLAPGINGLNKSLRILIIQSWEDADLSSMFWSINRLPLLEEFSIAIPVESRHLGVPEALSHFLTTHHRTLKTLRLRATQYGGRGLTPDKFSFDTWVRSAIHNVNLPKLRTLDISTILFPVNTSVSCLEQFSHTITSLSLTGCYRTYDDVEEAIHFVADKTRNEPLEKLRIGLVSLSPQLIDLISSKLPALYRLDLVVKYILPHATDNPKFDRGYAVESQSADQIDDFLTNLSSRTYPHWEIRHMSLLAECLPLRPHYESTLEQAFRRCVPSIRTFI